MDVLLTKEYPYKNFSDKSVCFSDLQYFTYLFLDETFILRLALLAEASLPHFLLSDSCSGAEQRSLQLITKWDGVG